MANPNAKLVPVNLAGTVNLNKYKADVDTSYSVYNKKNAPIFGGKMVPLQEAVRKTSTYPTVYDSTPEHEAKLVQGNSCKLYIDGKLFESGSNLLGDPLSILEIEGDYEEYYSNSLYVKKLPEKNKYRIHIGSLEKDIETFESPSFYCFENTITVVGGKSPISNVPLVQIYFIKEGSISDVGATYSSNTNVIAAKDSKTNTKLINVYEYGESKAVGSSLPAAPKYTLYTLNTAVPTKLTYKVEWSASGAPDSYIFFPVLSRDGTLTFAFFSKSGDVITPQMTKSYTISGTEVTITPPALEPPSAAVDSQWRITEDKFFPQVQLSVSLAYGKQKAILYLGADTFYYEGRAVSYKDKSELDYKIFFRPGSNYCLDFKGKPIRALMGKDGDLRAISFYQDYFDRGTLITPWNSISTEHQIYFKPSSVIYFDELSRKWVEAGEVWSQKDGAKNLTFYDSNNLVVNTPGYTYCINAETLEKTFFGDDWNNRVFGTKAMWQWKEETGSESSFFWCNRVPLDQVHTLKIASAVNSQYLVSGNPVASAIFPATTIYTEVSPDIKFNVFILQGARSDRPVDVFIDNAYAGSSKTVIWSNSNRKETQVFYDHKKEFLTYPIGDVYYNVPAAFKRIGSTTNQDSVKYINTSYSLLYFNNKEVFLYNVLSQINGLSDAFVIQGQKYGVIDGKIVQYSTVNSKISSTNAIVNVEGLKYIAATPYEAIFWSEVSRTFYSFTGDNILSPKIQADSISSISSTTYNPSTGTLAVSTNIGTLFLNQSTGVFLLEDFDSCECFSHKKGFLLVDKFPKKASVFGYHSFSMLDEGESISSNPRDIHLETELFGVGNNVASETDCWYIRLEDENRARREVTLKCKTLTDKGTLSEAKELSILPDDWDEETDTYYFRYQPQLQKGVGTSLEITTDANIASITASVTPVTTQISKFNI